MLAAILQYLKNIIGRSKIKVTVFENDLTCLIFFFFLGKMTLFESFSNTVLNEMALYRPIKLAFITRYVLSTGSPYA